MRPGWKTLFVQAVGNHLMAYDSYKPLARDEAARLEAFVGDHRSSVLGFFARMGRAGPADGVRDLLHPDASRAPPTRRGGPRRRAITGTEQAWLDAHVDADHDRDPYEEALLAFIADGKAGAKRANSAGQFARAQAGLSGEDSAE